MKQFLIATAALSLIGGAAFAQTTTATPDANQPAAPMRSAPAAAPTDSTAAPMSAPAAAPDASMTPTPPATDMSSASSTSTSTMAANTPAGSPPAAYPVCTSKHEDRCVNRYQATRMAKMATRHQKTDNVQPSGM